MKCKRAQPVGLSLKVAAFAAAIVLVLSDVSAGAERRHDVAGFHETMGLVEDANLPYSCQYLESTAPSNILWPGEQAAFTFQLVNNSDNPIRGQGKVEVISYGTISTPSANKAMFRSGEVVSTPINVDLAAKKTQNVTVRPSVPERLGGYALVVDLGKSGRSFVTSFVRTFKPGPMTIHYPQITCDGGGGGGDADVIARLGVCPNRLAFSYRPTTDANFEKSFEERCAQLEAYKKARLPVTVEFTMGGSREYQPLGRPRPHLDENGVMKNTKTDMTWIPSYDPDFKKMVKRVLERYGWPRGTVIGVKFMNEPWDGMSISGWGADNLRFREIYKAMAEATIEARKEYGVEVLIGGCDSSSNTFDKLFGDGKDDFLPYLDFCSLHYQGLNPPSTYKPWLERKGFFGRVRIWETEGSLAENKLSAAVAANLAAGYDHVVSIWYANMVTPKKRTKADKGREKSLPRPVADVWSPAAAVGAVVHFIGQRKFKEMLFKNGLPWVMVFNGDGDAGGQAKIDPEDGTVVVVGDLGAVFGHDSVLFRNARGPKEVAEMAKLKAQLAALPADARNKDRIPLQRAIRFGGVLSGASLTLANPDGKFHLYDIYGNEIQAEKGKTRVPLNERGFFLRGNGTPGSFAALLDAIRDAKVTGIEPLAKKCHDMLSPVDKPGAVFRLELTNVLNRPVQGLLSVQVEGLKAEPASQNVHFAADETMVFSIKVSGAARPDNRYRMKMLFDGGADGKSVHEEDLHVNLIARRTINVDGNLDDWKGVLPQTIKVESDSGPTLTEKAWMPWEKFEEGSATGFALGYLAYDEKYLYFAAKVADSTPDGGTMRFETRDDNQFFYPEKCKAPKLGKGKNKGGRDALEELVWPQGVRRFSFRKDPIHPWHGDTLQIAFNVIDPGRKDWLVCPPGTMPGYIGYKDTDYEYCLYNVAEKFGGGTEIWRDNVPGMPHKHFVPRQGKSPFDGPVKDGKLVVLQGPTTRIVECAIPWTEIPEVRKKRDAGEPVKFTFRVNDGKGNACMELARDRSVSKPNPSFTFRPDYKEHWANELEFGFEK